MTARQGLLDLLNARSEAASLNLLLSELATVSRANLTAVVSTSQLPLTPMVTFDFFLFSSSTIDNIMTLERARMIAVRHFLLYLYSASSSVVSNTLFALSCFLALITTTCAVVTTDTLCVTLLEALDVLVTGWVVICLDYGMTEAFTGMAARHAPPTFLHAATFRGCSKIFCFSDLCDVFMLKALEC